MRKAYVSMLVVFLLAAIAIPGSPASASHPSCGVVLTSTTLAADCHGPMSILADGVRVNLNGHVVSCEGDRSLIGIELVGRSGVQTSNGSVTDCGVGVKISGGAKNSLVNLASTRHVYDVSGTTLNGGEGIPVSGSNDNEFKNVGSSYNANAGLWLSTSSNNRVRASRFEENRDDFASGPAGILIGINSHNNSITSSHFRRNLDARVLIFASNNNSIQSSWFIDNRRDPELTPLSEAGIKVQQESVGTFIRANKLSGNTYGILLFVDPDNPSDMGAQLSTVQANKSSGSGVFDMFDGAAGCGTNTWMSNSFSTANQPCIN